MFCLMMSIIARHFSGRFIRSKVRFVFRAVLVVTTSPFYGLQACSDTTPVTHQQETEQMNATQPLQYEYFVCSHDSGRGAAPVCASTSGTSERHVPSVSRLRGQHDHRGEGQVSRRLHHGAHDGGGAHKLGPRLWLGQRGQRGRQRRLRAQSLRDRHQQRLLRPVLRRRRLRHGLRGRLRLLTYKQHVIGVYMSRCLV